MTNSTPDTTVSANKHTDEQIEKTTMQSLYELLGFHHWKTRAVFDVDGKELVYLSDNCVGRIKLYLDGNEIYKGWTWFPGMYCDVSANHEGHEYRVLASIKNWITYSQKITVIVDDSKAQSRIDPVLGSLSGLEILHAFAGLVAVGLCLGFGIGGVIGS